MYINEEGELKNKENTAEGQKVAPPNGRAESCTPDGECRNVPFNENKPYDDRQRQQTEPSAVVVFSCLSTVEEVSLEDKQWITENHLEAHVEHAVKYLNDPSTIIKTTPSQALKWACKRAQETSCREPVPKKSATATTEENIEYLKLIEKNEQDGKRIGRYKIEVLSRSIEFNLDGGTEGNRIFSVESKTFIQDVFSFIKKITGN